MERYESTYLRAVDDKIELIHYVSWHCSNSGSCAWGRCDCRETFSSKVLATYPSLNSIPESLLGLLGEAPLICTRPLSQQEIAAEKLAKEAAQKEWEIERRKSEYRHCIESDSEWKTTEFAKFVGVTPQKLAAVIKKHGIERKVYYERTRYYGTWTIYKLKKEARVKLLEILNVPPVI